MKGYSPVKKQSSISEEEHKGYYPQRTCRSTGKVRDPGGHDTGHKRIHYTWLTCLIQSVTLTTYPFRTLHILYQYLSRAHYICLML